MPTSCISEGERRNWGERRSCIYLFRGKTAKNSLKRHQTQLEPIIVERGETPLRNRTLERLSQKKEGTKKNTLEISTERLGRFLVTRGKRGGKKGHREKKSGMKVLERRQREVIYNYLWWK